MSANISFQARYYLREKMDHAYKKVAVNSASTALLLRHTSNLGFDQEKFKRANLLGMDMYANPLGAGRYPDGHDKRYSDLSFKKESPYAKVLAMFENIPRMRKIIEEEIVPLVKAARKAGIRIMYVIDGWEAACKYPQWHELNRKVTALGPDCLPHVDGAWRKELEDEIFMPNFQEALAELSRVIDIAPPLEPLPDDWIVTNHYQAKYLLSANKISDVLHAGFDTNFGMFYSIAGIHRFCRTTRNFILRDCTTALERTDTVQQEQLKETSLWVMEAALRCYSASGKEIAREINSPIRA